MKMIFQKNYKNFNIIEFDSVDSTMNIAKNFPENSVIVAEEQINGKGKEERVWNSCNKGNLYFSLNILANNKKNYSQLSFLVSVAMRAAISKFNTLKTNSILSKWPNDILINEKKCCGILLNLDRNNLIIGCGVNIKEHPTQLTNFSATSLLNENINVNKMNLLEEFLNIFFILFQNWNINGFAKIREEWLLHCYKLKKEIIINDTKGIFENIDENGALILKLNNSNRIVINSGDIFNSFSNKDVIK